LSNKIKIGITFSESRYENYPKWIKGEDDDIELVELSWIHQNWDEIEDCDGIVLTGGVDMHPDFAEGARAEYPNMPKEFNKERDEFEMHVFETAMNFDHPILAICRGMQLVNVAMGGTLTQDLEEAGKNDHRRHGDIDGRHNITIAADTLLQQIAGETSGSINSAHHQGVDELAEELMINSYSPDSVPEGAEWKDKSDKPFLLCVQWHPERMQDKETNPLSKNIREKFLEAVRAKSQSAGSR
jgi:putative glutamine amidotransferase